MLQESTNSADGRHRANKTALRVAWFVIGAGVLVAMSAAVAGGMNPNANVLPIRNLAAVIMLLGMIIVLVAYRAAWLQSVCEKSEQGASVSHPRQRRELKLGLVVLFSILLGGAFLFTALLSLIGGVVSGYAILTLRTMMTVALVSLLVYGKGYVRTFCLGAIIPTGLQAFSLFNLMMLVADPSDWLQAGWSARQANLVSLFVSGILAMAAGIVAVVVRFLVEHLQGSDKPPHSPHAAAFLPIRSAPGHPGVAGSVGDDAAERGAQDAGEKVDGSARPQRG